MKSIRLFFFAILLFQLSARAQVDYYDLGHEVAHKGFNDSAIALYSKAIDSSQHLAKAYMHRAGIRAIQNDTNGAFEDLNKSKMINSTNSDLYYFYGAVYGTFKDTKEALFYFEKALSMNPKDADCYDGMALIEKMMGNMLLAIKYETKAIDLDTTSDATYYLNRGWYYAIAGLRQQALDDYNTSLKMRPGELLALMDRGLNYEDWGKYNEAIIDFTEVLTYETNNASILYCRGMCYLMINEKEKACTDFSKAAELKYALAIGLEKENCK